MIKPICRKCKAVIVEPPNTDDVVDAFISVEDTIRGLGRDLPLSRIKLLVKRYKALSEMVKHRYCKACVRAECDWSRSLVGEAHAEAR